MGRIGCCKSNSSAYQCEIAKNDWDGIDTHIIELFDGVPPVGTIASGTTITSIANDGSTIAPSDPSAGVSITIVPKQVNCLQIAVTNTWPDLTGPPYAGAHSYRWAQTFDELIWYPTGQNVTIYASLDLAFERFVLKRIFDRTPQTLFDLDSDVGNFSAPVVPVQLVARQGDNTFVLASYTGTGDIFGGITGWGRAHAGATNTTSALTNLSGPANVKNLNWCFGAPPIYFGISVAFTQQNYSPRGYATECDQTFRLDNFCMKIVEQKTPACPCFDSLFKASVGGGNIAETFHFDYTPFPPPFINSGPPGSAYDLTVTSNFPAREVTFFNNPAPNWTGITQPAIPVFTACPPLTPPVPAPAWCFFICSVTWSGNDKRFTGSFIWEYDLIPFTAVASKWGLWVDKPTRRAVLVGESDWLWNDMNARGGERSPPEYDPDNSRETVTYACENFTYRGGTFEKTNLPDPCTILFAAWTSVEQLSDPIRFQQRQIGISGFPISIDDSMPDTIDVTAVNLDGSDFLDEIGAGSCTGHCLYVAAYNAGTSGPMHWVFTSSNCSDGCECPGSPTSNQFISSYGNPAHIGDTLAVGCRDAINSPPVGKSKIFSSVIANPYTLTLDDFSFSDPNNYPPHNFIAVQIITTAVPGWTGPSLGSLTLSGSPVVSGTFVTVADIAAGKLKFHGGASVRGRTTDVFSFRVQDDGGTAHDGIDTDNGNNTSITMPVRLNHAPVGANKTKSITTAQTLVFGASDFAITDPNDSPPDALMNVRIMSLPTAGILLFFGNPVPVNFVIGVDNLAHLSYVPSGAGSFGFNFQVQDDGGTAHGGVDTDPIVRTMTITVT